MQFPRLTARDLEGRSVEIPAGLGAALNLVVLAFEREHQRPVESWLRHLADLEREFPGLEAWQVVALSRSYRLFRGAIDNAMRKGIADEPARRHTLVAYLDLHDLQRDLGLRDTADIRLYLLDGKGNVRWQGVGSFGEATLDSLRAAIGETGGNS